MQSAVPSPQTRRRQGRVGSGQSPILGWGGEGGLAVQTKSAVQQLETLALQPVVFRQHRQFLGSARCHFPRTQLSPPSTPPQGGREGWGDVRVMVVVVVVGGVGGGEDSRGERRCGAPFTPSFLAAGETEGLIIITNIITIIFIIVIIISVCRCASVAWSSPLFFFHLFGCHFSPSLLLGRVGGGGISGTTAPHSHPPVDCPPGPMLRSP